MTARLDGREAVTCAAFHAQIAQALDFPACYGRNLDALYDCLTDLPAGSELVFHHIAAFREAVGAVYAARVLRVLRDAADEGRFRLICEE